MQSKDQGRRKPRKPKKFRYQIVSDWIDMTFPKGRVADIGGGKGLLAYLLQQKGWNATVIDPESQDLPHKYKDLDKKRFRIPEGVEIPKIQKPFTEEMAKDFDLLVGLHAHGSNISIIDAAAEYHKSFLLVPCCVIDEPIEKRSGVNWRESLIDYAKSKGLDVQRVKFEFMGKDMGLYVKS